MLLGHVSTVGASTSFTVTLNVHEPELLDVSTAVCVTVVVPTANVLPLVGDDVELETAQFSTVFANPKLTLAEQAPSAVPCVTGPGHVSCGAWLSDTTTLNEHVLVRPLASVTRNESVVVPSGCWHRLLNPPVWLSCALAQLSQ